MKKKILMVCESFGGGVFAYVSQLCNDMVEYFDIYLVYAVRQQTPKNYKEFLDRRVNLIEVKSFGNLKNIFSDIKTIRTLRRIEKEIMPDVIHLHSSIAGGIGRIAFKGKKNKVVYTPHGYSFILMGNNTKEGKMYELMEKILGKKNALTLTCCESEDEVARKICKKTAYIETGINLKDLSEHLDNIPANTNKDFTVFTLGRICIQKQPELFNEIAKLVPEAKFTWIGNGELENKLTAPNIEITGWKPRKEALAMAKAADVYILCSMGEAVAMSLIENMYIKKLCLVSNVMGNKSVIRDGQNGYICEKAEDYAKKIKDAMKNFPNKLTENAYQDVLNIYNTEVMKKKYIEFYNDLIGGKYEI